MPGVRAVVPDMGGRRKKKGAPGSLRSFWVKATDYFLKVRK